MAETTGDKFLKMQNRIAELTGVAPDNNDCNDQNVLDLFIHTDTPDKIASSPWRITTIGLPGIETLYAAKMYGSIGSRIRCFNDIVRLDSLTHGSGVWENNQKILFAENKLLFDDVICCREDVQEYCRDRFHMDEALSFRVMEAVRKGHGISKALFREEKEYNQLPEWFIECCKRIKYLYPKMKSYYTMQQSMRLARYRLYYPEAFYTAYFELSANKTASVTDMAVADEMHFRGIDIPCRLQIKQNTR